MTKIDRSRFKATKIADTEQSDKETESIVGRKSGNPDYLNLTDGGGVHKYRIYPPHPDDDGKLYAVPKGTHFLPCEVPKKDDKGNIIKDKHGNEVTEIKKKPVFNAKIHGGQKRDLIEEYTLFAQKKALEKFPNDDKKREAFLAPLFGDKAKKDYSGIQLQQKWVMYVKELLTNGKKIFGRLEIPKSVKDRLNKLAATESTGDVIGTDPFTDVDYGAAIIVTYNKDADPKDKYQTELYQPKVEGDKTKLQMFPMTDEDIEEWLKADSLKKMFVNVYDSKTFELVLNGLKNFDEENKMGIIGEEEFLDIVDELLQDVPVHVEEQKDAPTAEGEEEEEDEKDGDEFDNMDRDELKEYNSKNKLGIVVLKKTTDDELRVKIREILAQREEESEEEEEEDDEIEQDETGSVEEEVKPEPAKTTKTTKVQKIEPPITDPITGLPWDENGTDLRDKKADPAPTESKTTSVKDRLAAIKSKKTTK